MESAIVNLSERLENDPSWTDAITNLDRNLLSMSQRNVAQITAYFAHEEELNERLVKMAWLGLQLQTLYFFRELDASGVSSVIGQVAPEYLGDFSYTDAIEFRSIEENLASDLQIPAEAWELFWRLIDQHKDEFISQMREYESYSFYQHLFPSIAAQFQIPPSRFRHLSPFRWSKAVAGGIGTVLGIADPLTAILALPFGIGIAAASIMGAGVCAGYIAGAEGQKPSEA